MDEFKLKSLDDFDSMFMSSNKSAAKQPAAPVQQPATPAYQAPVAPVQQPAAQAYKAPAAPVQQPVTQAYRAPAVPVQQPVAVKKENLIPEMESGPVEIDFFGLGDSSGAPAAPAQQPAAPVTPAAPIQQPAAPAAPAAPRQESNVYRAAPVQQPIEAAPVQASDFGNAPQSAQPPVSLYRSEGMQDNGIKQFLYEPDRNDDVDDYNPDEKSGGDGVLPLVGKVLSIIMLAATLIVFVIGCFITIFLNNKDSKCGSMCFATLAEDATGIGSGKDDSISSGSLVVCKSLDISEYKASDVVAVPIADATGCKLYQVVSVDADSELLTITDTSGEDARTLTKKTDDIYGLATYNFGGLGKVIQFASNNAVLVCILFLLLAALWCLFIILIERSQEKKAPKEDEDDSDNGGLSF